jgi:hypothetical protein
LVYLGRECTFGSLAGVRNAWRLIKSCHFLDNASSTRAYIAEGVADLFGFLSYVEEELSLLLFTHLGTYDLVHLLTIYFQLPGLRHAFVNIGFYFMVVVISIAVAVE